MQPVDTNDLIPNGHGLVRPECVLALSDGTLCSADWRGGVCITRPDKQHLIQAKGIDFELKPNGIALLSDGTFVVAHLGDDRGGLYRLFTDGRCEPMLLEIDGQPLPPCNFPHIDPQGRIWLTVSTRHHPRAQAYRSNIADGFIVLIDDKEPRIVADGLGYTNECCVHPNGKHLYVNETFARRLSRYEISQTGFLSKKTTIAKFSAGTYPDGLTFDEQGGIWITSIVSNRVIYCNPYGELKLILQDVSEEHLDWVEQAYQTHAMGRPHLDNAAGKKLKNISSLAFGGPDLKTAYLGCLLGDTIFSFPAPVKGYPPVHWDYRLNLDV